MNYKQLSTEFALMILHDCLVPEGAKQVLNEPSLALLLTAQKDGVTLHKRIEDLAAFPDGFSKEFIEQLTDLRKVLLGS